MTYSMGTCVRCKAAPATVWRRGIRGWHCAACAVVVETALDNAILEEAKR